MLRNIFSTGLVQFAIVLFAIVIVWYLVFKRGWHGYILNPTLNSFDIKVNDGFKTIYNKTFSWGDSLNESIGGQSVSMTSDSVAKTAMIVIKWSGGGSSWIKYDYLNNKSSYGKA